MIWTKYIGYRARFTPSGAPVQKKCGAQIYEYPVTPSPRLPSPDTVGADTHIVIIDILLRTRAAMHTTIAKSFPLFPNHYFNIFGLLPCCKKLEFFLFFLWGPLFVGAPVRPNITCL